MISSSGLINKNSLRLSLTFHSIVPPIWQTCLLELTLNFCVSLWVNVCLALADHGIVSQVKMVPIELLIENLQTFMQESRLDWVDITGMSGHHMTDTEGSSWLTESITFPVHLLVVTTTLMFMNKNGNNISRAKQNNFAEVKQFCRKDLSSKYFHATWSAWSYIVFPSHCCFYNASRTTSIYTKGTFDFWHRLNYLQSETRCFC